MKDAVIFSLNWFLLGIYFFWFFQNLDRINSNLSEIALEVKYLTIIQKNK